MRFQELYSICKDVSALWEEPTFSESRMANGSQYSTMTNTDNVITILTSLEQCTFLRDRINKIKKTSPRFNQLSGRATFDASSKSSFLKEYAALKDNIMTIKKMFDSIEYEQNSEGFDVKLPSEISLSDLGKCAKDLDMIFTQCLSLSKTEERISLSALDVGSMWLSFSIVGIVSVGVLNVIADFIDKAIIIRSHYLTVKRQEELLRQLKMSTEIIELNKESYEKVGKALLEKVTSDLAQEYSITSQEENEHLKLSIEHLSKWLEKGLEFHAAVQASPEAKAIFEPIESKFLSENSIKSLKTLSELSDGKTDGH